jgi:hypothetical protein
VRTVLVVVVVVVVAAGVLRAVVAWVRLGPSRRVLRLGRAVERVVRVVWGATVRLLRAMRGMIVVGWLVGWRDVVWWCSVVGLVVKDLRLID